MAEADSLPTRQWELIVVSIVFLVLGTVFTGWRLYARIKVSSWVGPSDWLMVLGVVCTGCDNTG